VSRLAEMLNEAKRPLILAGGGVIAAEASDDVAALAHKAQIPVTTTMMGIGAIDERDPLALGMSGMYGTSVANRALREADLVLALGVRFNDRTTGDVAKFARQAKIVHVDCDPSSIDKNLAVALGIVADVKDLLTVVNSRIHPTEHAAWAASLKRADAASRAAKAPTGAVDPRAVVDAFSSVTKGEALVVTDVGQHQLWVARGYRHVYPRHFLTSGGMGAMGFGIPAAIGAAIARPSERVVAFVGDGGAQMTFEELIVAAELNLDVTFVVFVNRALGLVRQMQKEHYGAKFFATDLRVPDFVRLAEACGVKAVRVADERALDAAVRRVRRAKGPLLLEVAIPKEACV
jgi:acetolactate synthase I/II/III large subunit